MPVISFLYGTAKLPADTPTSTVATGKYLSDSLGSYHPDEYINTVWKNCSLYYDLPTELCSGNSY